jgi:hypothetical protein
MSTESPPLPPPPLSVSSTKAEIMAGCPTYDLFQEMRSPYIGVNKYTRNDWTRLYHSFLDYARIRGGSAKPLGRAARQQLYRQRWPEYIQRGVAGHEVPISSSSVSCGTTTKVLHSASTRDEILQLCCTFSDLKRYRDVFAADPAREQGRNSYDRMYTLFCTTRKGDDLESDWIKFRSQRLESGFRKYEVDRGRVDPYERLEEMTREMQTLREEIDELKAQQQRSADAGELRRCSGL